jgi:FG-GAP repeat protein
MISPTHPRLIPRAVARTGRPFAAVSSVLVAALALLCALAPASPAAPLEQKLSITGSPGVLFGYSAAVDGDTLVVGDPLDGAEVGAVYVFQRSGGSWANTAKLTASDGSTGDLLGVSVAIRGDTIVAGATGDGIDRNVTNEGAVYTFARTGAPERTQTAKLTDRDADRLGRRRGRPARLFGRDPWRCDRRRGTHRRRRRA